MGKNSFTYVASPRILGSIPYVASSRQELAVENGIPRDYYLESLDVELAFRLAITGGTTNGNIAAEIGQNLIEQFEISGNHKTLGDFTRLKLPADYVYQQGSIDLGYSQLRTGVPASGAVANSDIKIHYHIPFIPPRVHPAEQIFYLLDAPNWDTLQFYAYWGSANSLIVGGDRTLTLTAYGLGTGNPSLLVTRNIVKLSDQRNNLRTIPFRQSFKTIDISNSQSLDYVTNLVKGNLIRRYALKTGVAATGNSAGTTTTNWASLTDSAINQFQIKRDDQPQRNVYWNQNKSREGGHYKLPFSYPLGYNQIDFVKHGSLLSAYNTRDLATNGLRWEFWSDITGVANQKLLIVADELASVPVLQ